MNPTIENKTMKTIRETSEKTPFVIKGDDYSRNKALEIKGGMP